MATLLPRVELRLVSSIIIPPSRQREHAEADATLIASIEQRGLLNPIIIHEDGTLVAGERRLDAHRKLQRADIRCTIFESLTAIEQFEIELMENLAREDLTWQERTKAVGAYHSMRVDAFPAWTQMGTATALGLSQPTIARTLVVYAQITDDEISGCLTQQAAFNLISARAERARVAAQSRGLQVTSTIPIAPAFNPNDSREERTKKLLDSVNLTATTAESINDLDKALANIEAGQHAAALLDAQRHMETSHEVILNADFLDWAESYCGDKFDVIHADFPYGKGYSGSRTRRTGKAHSNPTYADDPDIYKALVEGFLTLQDNFVYPVAHCLFWFDMQYYQWTVEMFEAFGWTLVQPFPFIWSKGNQGVAADVRRRPRHVYETALLFARGDRKISKLINDHFACPVDEKLHLNQKPIAMLEYFLSLIVDEHTAVLDPTCGSGSALVAATKLKAHRIFGLELEESNAEVARFLLQRQLGTAPVVKEQNNDNPM